MVRPHGWSGQKRYRPPTTHLAEHCAFWRRQGAQPFGLSPLAPPKGYGEKAARCVVGGRTFLVPLHGGAVHGGTALRGGTAMTSPAICGCICFIYVWRGMGNGSIYHNVIIVRLIEFLSPPPLQVFAAEGAKIRSGDNSHYV